MKPAILLADHDPASQCIIEMTLRQRVPCRLVCTKYGYEALEQVARHDDIALAVIDVGLPDMKGLEVLEELRRQHPDLPVMMTAGVRDECMAMESLARGAVDFLNKADSPQRIATVVKTVLAGERAPSFPIPPQPSGDDRPDDPFARIIGSSPALDKARHMAKQAAESDVPVLLRGESGVGKEVFARAIHAIGPRAQAPFVAVNCGAIPPNLVESTFFGHEKGAFTGAIGSAPGKFREADGGVMFLDEVGELPPDMQVKLLRVLQEKEVQPVGGGAPVTVDVRIISATNIDFNEAIASGRFREDLYYRLNVFPIDIPPLRKRGEKDIQALAEIFCERCAREEGKNITGISAAAMALLAGYGWPGNVRQLENAVHRAVILANAKKLHVEDFIQISNALQQQQQEHNKTAAVLEDKKQIAAMPSSFYGIQLLRPDGEFKNFKQIEAEVMRQAIHYYRWHITNIAKALGITRATVYKKMEAADIQDPRTAATQVQEGDEK